MSHSYGFSHARETAFSNELMLVTARQPDVRMADGRQVVLILDDDRLVTEGLSLGLEQDGRTVITCNDLESAQIVVETLKPSHIVADVRLTGAFAFEGLDFIGYAKHHSPASRVILMSGDASEPLQLEASNRGAVGFLQKPFGGRELGALITLMSSGLSAKTGPATIVRMPLLNEVLASADLYPVFQPIVRLGPAWKPFGYESLARYRTDSLLSNPTVLFDYANRKRLVHELEFECIRRTLAAAAPATAGATLFVNVHPNVMSSGRELVELLATAEPHVLKHLVLELTEHAEMPDTPQVSEAIEQIHALGVRFAFDDFGVAHSHLSSIGRVRPSFLKISQLFGTDFEADPTRVKIIRNIVSIATDFGCELILEGIEQTATAEAAANLGIHLGQGYLFGRPTQVAALNNARPFVGGKEARFRH
jgi:EAL domain-containing protein (putative c-di-GMP-specific phosphodiesterase class I)/ActR/RegA family two-component response regulator